MSAELAPLHHRALALAEPARAQSLKPWQMGRLDALMARIAPALDALRSGSSDATVKALLMECAEVSDVTARRWLVGLKAQGPSALVDDYKGRRAVVEPWHPRARYYFQLPTKPGDADIASRLRQEGYGLELKLSTFAKQVSRLRKRMPASETEVGRQASGWHYHWQNRTPYTRRDWRHVPVGYRYEVDGHTCDFYIEHPHDGSYFQPELTLWMDVRSRMVVGFWVGETENSADLRHSLSSTILLHNHVPAEIFLDHGAGKAETFTDAVSGYCAKLGIHPEFARARNARSKIIEAEFRRFEDRFGRFQPCYINRRTDDFFREFAAKWKRGKVPRVTLWQFLEELQRYFDYRNRESMQVQGEWVVPAELFQTLDRNPALIEADAIDRPREERTVRRATVSIFKRDFCDTALNAVEGRKVLVEYDELSLDRVWVYRLDGSFVSTASVVREQPGVAPNVVAERLARKELGQLKRLEVKRADVLSKNRAPLIGSDELEAMSFEPSPTAAMLAQRHSLQPVLMAATSPPCLDLAAPPRLDTRTQEILADLTQFPTLPATARHSARPLSTEDEITQRFARAQQIEAQLASGDDVPQADQEWLARYRNTAEYRGQMRFVQAFLQQSNATGSEHGQG